MNPAAVKGFGFCLAVVVALGCAGGGGAAPAGSGGASGGSAGAASGGAGGAADGAASSACQACQLASMVPNCTPALLTATTTVHPETGDPVAEGWGLETLSRPALRDAALSLLRCINTYGCATNATNTGPGSNAVLGCLGGVGIDPLSILAGALEGPCVSAYKAAAVADGLNQVGDTDAQFALTIARAAFDPSRAVGLPDTLVQCAIEAPCPACQGI